MQSKQDTKDTLITPTNKPKLQQKRNSMICCPMHVSESEIKMGYPLYEANWEDTTPEVFKNLLFSLGLNIEQEYTRQDAIQHRNRMNQQVTCSRWYGSERCDEAWIKSGYASKAAIDRNLNNNLLDDSYRSRYETMDAQYMLEQRDRYAKVED